MVNEMSRSGHSRWIYFLPVLHLFTYMVSMIGQVVPSLSYLGLVSTYLMYVDFPISLVALALVWKYSALAAAWILVAGTLWWYLLSRGAELVIVKLRDRGSVPHDLIPKGEAGPSTRRQD